MSSRTKKIIGAIVALILILLLLLLLWLASQQPPEVTPAPEEQTPPPSQTLTPSPTLQPPVFESTEPAQPDAEPDEEADPRNNLSRVAAAFAERYGSYSNQGDYENLEELQSLMTESLAAETQAFIDQARSGEAGAAYVGLTTRALNTNVSSYSEESGAAAVVVKTQREKITAEGSQVYYQDIELDFVLVGESWQVSSASWVEDSE